MTWIHKPNDIRNNHIPKILCLNADGVAQDWITYEEYANYKLNDKIVWSLGKIVYTLKGGINAKTQQQSTLEMESIIAIKNDTGKKRKIKSPPLTNNALFNRDGHRCAYCNGVYSRNKLTRDHIIPLSKGGLDVFENTITACFKCNQKKGDKFIEECGMTLLFKPYHPSYYENLIIKNRQLTKEQFDFLIVGVSKHSRVFEEFHDYL